MPIADYLKNDEMQKKVEKKIADYLKNDEIYYAHRDGVPKKVETLEEHSSLTHKYAKKIIDVQRLWAVFIGLGERFFEKDSDNYKLWEWMFFDTIYLHDLGKANVVFQNKKMNNPNFKNAKNATTAKGFSNYCSQHSLSSAGLYSAKYLNLFSDEHSALFPFLFINAFVIARHHGYLKSFSSFWGPGLKESNSDLSNFYKTYAPLLKDITVDFSILNFDADLNCLKNWSAFFTECLENFEQDKKFRTADFYIYAKFLYSLLVSADFYATSDYMSGLKPVTADDFGVITNVRKFLDPFESTDVYKSIQKYAKHRKSGDFADINEARSEMFLEAEENLLKNTDKNLFYLEAPTGSGKTNTAINLSLRLVENCPDTNKIFYVFPFNTLVEQTRDTLLKSFGGSASVGSEIGVINSITPIYEENESDGKVCRAEDGKNIPENIDYKAILTGRQFLHYPIVVTTHVKLFDWLFGVGRESHFPLCKLANSVVVLDEIQSYKNGIWKEIAIFLSRFAEILNIKFIIMSATLPKIGALISGDENFGQNDFVELISDRKKYFECKFFKDRVVPNFDLIDEFETSDEPRNHNEPRTHNEPRKTERLAEKIFEEFQKGNDVLVEFIKKSRSLEFFKDFKEKFGGEIPEKSLMLMNGDDNLYARKKIIETVKDKNRDYRVILISTQVIEAGVDVDFDIGFKDISILDAEEQFMGRINRSCKKTGNVVYFFDLDKMKDIYKDDKRNEFTLKNPEIRENLKNKDFGAYYAKVLGKVDEETKTNTENNLEKFRTEVLQKLDFMEIREKMKLLKDDNSYSIFLNRTIELDNGKKLVGSEVWREYKELLEDFSIDYSEKQVKLSQKNNELSYFTYNVRRMAQTCNDTVGDLYYFENGERFLTEDGKFDRKKFEGSGNYDYEFI